MSWVFSFLGYLCCVVYSCPSYLYFSFKFLFEVDFGRVEMNIYCWVYNCVLLPCHEEIMIIALIPYMTFVSYSKTWTE